MSLKKNIIAFIFIGLLGVLGHFFYKWSGENTAVGLFFPVNESTWEHLKLLFFPTLIYSVGEYIFCEEKPRNYIPAIVISVFYGMLTIVALFYTINGILGFNVDFINILIYFISVIVTLCKKRRLIQNGKFASKTSRCIFLGIAFLTAVLFAVFSYNPPSLGLFTPPV